MRRLLKVWGKKKKPDRGVEIKEYSKENLNEGRKECEEKMGPFRGKEPSSLAESFPAKRQEPLAQGRIPKKKTLEKKGNRFI